VAPGPYGGAENDGFEALVATGDVSFLLAGYTRSEGAGGFDGWLVKVDRDGRELWRRTYGGTGNYKFEAVAQASDGGFLVDRI